MSPLFLDGSTQATPLGVIGVVALVTGVLGLQLLILVPIVLWLKKRMRELQASVRAGLEASGERIERGPESAVYRGASERLGRVKGNGVLVLTDRRLVFHKLVGGGVVEVPVGEIRGVREARWFLGAYNGRDHVILKLLDGVEVGFNVREHSEWMELLRKKLY
jgi:hypothetical protein